MEWYSKNFRRHLCDMHIEDFDERFLSEFSAEDYYEKLKEAKVTAAMIYFQSHIGYCYYPTKSGKMHNAFVGREYEMKKLVDLCRANGIAVVGYYSLNYNTWAADVHPDWQVVKESGKTGRDEGSRYGICCPNNPEYRDFVYEQIKEMSEIFTVDGMFYDMPFWADRCYCKHCRERYARERGGEIPRIAANYDAEKYGDFIRLSKDWMGEFSLWVTDVTRKLFPGVSVEQNYAQAALPVHSLSEKTNDACDYIGGDLHKDAITNSFACKYYYSATHNQPFEYMLSRCTPNLQAHTITKTKDVLTAYTLLTCAHHGATLMIDAIDPVGTLNPKFYSLLGEVFEREIPYEKYLSDGKMLADVGVFYHYESRYKNLQGQKHTNYTGTMNAVCDMVKSHIPVGVIASENMPDLTTYKFIILSNPHHLTKDMIKALISYTENGGTLYFSNADETELMKTLVGAECTGYTEECKTYVGAEPEYVELMDGYDKKYPLPFNCRLPILKGYDEKYVAARVVLPYVLSGTKKCASIHSNPPGEVTDIPALIIKPYGKGTVIWSASPIENESILDYRRVMENLVKKYASEEPSLKTDASPNIEIVTFKDKKRIRVSAVSLDDAEVAIPYPEFDISVKTDKAVSEVLLLPEEKPIAFTEKDGFVSFKARALNIFDMYEIRFK